jgi:cytoskeletal protein CcmA (bactofilin family)
MGILGTKKSTDEAPAPAAGLSIIAVGMTVNGSLHSNGTVKIEGTVEGHVRTRAQVLVAKGGLVRGDIEAREAVIGGLVDGAIRTSERVEIQAGAAVNGDVTTRRILVAEGGMLNGQVRMGEAAKEAPAAGKTDSGHGQPAVATVGQTMAVQVSRPSVPVARVAVPPRLPTSGSGV